MEKKPIIINQRIPLHILEVALTSYLKGGYSREYIIEQLQLEFSGENRIKKAYTLVNKIILYNNIKEFVDTHREQLLTAIKKKDDLDLILISLLNATFPFAFDVLSTFGRYFSVQDLVSTEAIKKPIAAIYGGNRSMENALYSVIPMFVEAGFFTRKTPGIYEFRDTKNYYTNISFECFEESYKANKRGEGFQSQFLLEPYFHFLVPLV